MAQIQAGTAYVDGAQVTAINLNAHVNNASLIPGAIDDQAVAGTVVATDTVLLRQPSGLKKATISQLPYVNVDGTVPMTGELVLSNSTPSGALIASSKGYVDGRITECVLKTGSTMTGPLVLSASPANALEAAPKQYVDTKEPLLGYTPVNKAGDTMTGALVLPSANPTEALQATHKQYVDAQVATRIPTGGATVSGNYLFSNKLQTSTSASENNDVVNKSYLDTFISAIPQLAASATFSTCAIGEYFINTSSYLNVTATRASGSNNLIVNYSSLDARYNNSAAPFFLPNQYVGIDTTSGSVTDGLYKIIAVDLTLRTFTVTTTQNTSFSGSIKLSLVYDSTNLPSGKYGFNVKSIYYFASKFYVNFIKNIVTGQSGTTQSPLVQVQCFQASGSGVTSLSSTSPNESDLVRCLPMLDVGRTTYIDSGLYPEGLGANSLGCHIGFNTAEISALGLRSALWSASFLITAQLPPA